MEEVPLKQEPENSDAIKDASPTVSTKHSGKGREVIVSRTKLKLIIALVVLVILIVLVIVLAALLGVAAARKDGSKHPKSGPTPTPTRPLPTTAGTEPYWKVRLPKNVIPIHYDILLKIDLAIDRFDGTVDILVQVNTSTTYIILHSYLLKVTEVTIREAGTGALLSIEKHFSFPKNQFHVIVMREAVKPGKYIITMEFGAPLTRSLVGLYMGSYRNPKKNKTVKFAATQFEALRARRALPCFDEPAMKATYNVTLGHAQEFISLSNMPRRSSETRDGFVYDHFQRTVKMSTYLLVFVVCDFESIHFTYGNGPVKGSYYAPVGQKDRLYYAKMVGNRSLLFFEEYFGIPYQLPKADMIALPAMRPGAMEHWGLITYRETALLFSPKDSAQVDKMGIATNINHEVAHQWFGNIVTMDWWTDLWLNEGFASYLVYVGTNAVHPEWDIWGEFVNRIMERAFKLDGLATSHPVLMDLEDPNEILSFFDAISYSKGGSILRMLQSFLGEKTFKKGLTRYLKRHAYANAVSADLWKALGEQSKADGNPIDVKQVMDTWTLQMNYPVITIKKPTPGKLKAEVVQERFLYDPDANVTSKYPSPFGYKWIVPFTFCTATSNCSSVDSEKDIVWLNKSNGVINWDGKGWIKGNVHHRGFYRVNYDRETWSELAKQLKGNLEVLTFTDRAGLFHDAFSLARAKRLNYSDALPLTEYLVKETKYVPWKAARAEFLTLRFALPRSRPAYKYLEKYMKYLAKPLYDQLGFEDDNNHGNIFNRGIALKIFCEAGEPSCLRNATSLFKRWMEDPVKNAVPPNLRTLVYLYGIANGGVKEWDFMFNQYLASNVAVEKKKLLYGLSGSPEPWIIRRFLEYSLDSSKIPFQDTRFVFSYVVNNNPIGRPLAWDFFRINLQRLMKWYGSSTIIRTVTGAFSNEWELKQMKETFGDQGMKRKAVVQAIQQVEANIAWRKHSEKEIEAWLKAMLQKLNISTD